MKKSLTQGFTLIELLVVIAILGILAAVVLVAINPGQRIKEANDSGVKSAVGQVATALESCFTNNGGKYASGKCDTVANLISGGYLKQNPATSSQSICAAATGQYVTSGTSACMPYVKVDATFDNATTYEVMNSTTGCASPNIPFFAYHTGGAASPGKGTVECDAAEPAVP
jgi:type IV pilus assembly protein PilA